MSVPAGSPEQALADKLHEEYNVWVLFGEKAYDRAQFFSESYSIQSAEESVNLLKVMLSTSYTLDALEVLESELSRYPKGFFSQFSKSLVINLVGRCMICGRMKMFRAFVETVVTRLKSVWMFI